MQRLYSQSTGCTYFDEYHKEIPGDAVPISEERFLSVLANPAPGKRRAHDPEGLPVLNDPPPLTVDELAANERAWRDGKILQTTWLRERHRDQQDAGLPTTLDAEQFTELLIYLQDLRDWPQSEQFPAVEYRPAAPAWIADQNQ
jgi:hypothetical protein